MRENKSKVGTYYQIGFLYLLINSIVAFLADPMILRFKEFINSEPAWMNYSKMLCSLIAIIVYSTACWFCRNGRHSLLLSILLIGSVFGVLVHIGIEFPLYSTSMVSNSADIYYSIIFHLTALRFTSVLSLFFAPFSLGLIHVQFSKQFLSLFAWVSQALTILFISSAFLWQPKSRMASETDNDHLAMKIWSLVLSTCVLFSGIGVYIYYNVNNYASPNVKLFTELTNKLDATMHTSGKTWDDIKPIMANIAGLMQNTLTEYDQKSPEYIKSREKLEILKNELLKITQEEEAQVKAQIEASRATQNQNNGDSDTMLLINGVARDIGCSNSELTDKSNRSSIISTKLHYIVEGRRIKLNAMKQLGNIIPFDDDSDIDALRDMLKQNLP